MKRNPLYYGLVSLNHLVDINCLVASIMPGANALNTLHLLLETCAAETNLCQLKDPTPDGAGAGAQQMDEDTFDWIQTKYAKSVHADRIEEQTGIVIGKVAFAELRNNPLLAAIFCRLRYAAVTDPIPATLPERAAYWKKYYNTYHPNAKGTVEGYIEKAALLRQLDLGRSKLWDQS
jgi:hypothetical protein